MADGDPGDRSRVATSAGKLIDLAHLNAASTAAMKMSSLNPNIERKQGKVDVSPGQARQCAGKSKAVQQRERESDQPRPLPVTLSCPRSAE